MFNIKINNYKIMGMTIWHPCHENNIHDLVYILQIYGVKCVDMYLKFYSGRI